MKKNIYVQLLCLSFCFLKLQAQEMDIKAAPRLQIHHEIGFNGMPLLKPIFNFSSNPQAESPYLLMYKLSLGKNIIRMSGGGKYSNKKEFIADFLDSKTLRTTNVAARIGYGRQHQTGKICFNYGIDAIWEYNDNRNISDSGFDKVQIIDIDNGIGGGPFMGISWLLGEHFNLYMETGIYYITTTTLSQKDFTNNPDFNDIENSTALQRVFILPPTALFLQYKF
jgi:hypothetical protein